MATCGETRGLRSPARLAEGGPVGSARRLASRRAGPWAPLAGSLRAGQARGLRSQARFAQGRPVGSARRLASRRAGDEGSIQLLVIGTRVADPSQAQDDSPRKKSWEA